MSEPVLASSSLTHDVKYGLRLSSVKFHNKQWGVFEFKPSERGYVIGLYGAIITCTVSRIINKVRETITCDRKPGLEISFSDHCVSSLEEILENLPSVLLWYKRALNFEDKVTMTGKERDGLTQKTIAFSRNFFSGLNIPIIAETFLRRSSRRILYYECLESAIELRRLFCGYKVLCPNLSLTERDRKFLRISSIASGICADRLDCGAYALLKRRVQNAIGWILSAIEGMPHKDSLEFYNNDGLSLLKNWGYCSVDNPTRKDLVVYLLNSNGKIKITHVGIYLGEGFVESKPGNIDPGIYCHRIGDVPLYYGLIVVFFRENKRITI